MSTIEQQLCARLATPLHDLAARWGFESLRPAQRQGLEEILKGRDVLLVMPTGAGKSLIYQLASQCQSGLTIVVTPLIALMSDQLQSLRQRGVPAVSMHSQQSAEENEAALAAVVSGQTRLLYLAPERLRSNALREGLRAVKVSLFVVDEAHCITGWGHDFRPAYLALAESIRELGRPTVAALTATATPAAQREIIEHLALERPFCLASGFDRPNLHFSSITLCKEHKNGTLAALLRRHNGPCLVYTGTRKLTEEIAAELQATLRRPVVSYHGGMAAGDREASQEAFLTLSDLVMVATNAFGMGIDRRDLSLVLHHTLPGSLESYYQEAGRAGRAGQPASAILLHASADRRLHEFFIRESMLSAQEYRRMYTRIQEGAFVHNQRNQVALDHLERAGMIARRNGGWAVLEPWGTDAAERLRIRSEQIRRVRLRQLDDMETYANACSCRRNLLVGYFGETCSGSTSRCCDCCDRQAYFRRPPRTYKTRRSKVT